VNEIQDYERRTAALAQGRQRLTDHRRAKFMADGIKALAMREQGASPAEILAEIGGSRPRMYKAIHAAMARGVDELLL
jgi:hypothetical protein